mmetsp:Transcript_43569/g.139872  ORF Transcript_43569/g.139872 Transcript_43569/m.139872 type:complete len:121 (+) Transcript_43569:26-388(+)
MLHIGFLLAAILLDQFTSLGKTGCQAARASEWAGRRCRMEIGGGEDGFAEGALRATEAGEGVELSAASDANDDSVHPPRVVLVALPRCSCRTGAASAPPLAPLQSLGDFAAAGVGRRPRL